MSNDRFIGSRRRVRAVHDGRYRWEPEAPLHAVDRSGAAACGAVGLLVFVDAGEWVDDVDPGVARCPTCVARRSGCVPVRVDVRNLHNGLDIDASLSGSLGTANLDALVRNLRRLASRQPATLRVDLAQLELEAEVGSVLAPLLADLRRALAEEGGVLVLAGIPPALAAALSVDAGPA